MAPRATDRWDARIARARELAAHHPATAEPLEFYAGLAARQKALLDGLPLEPGAHPGRPLIGALELEPLADAIPELTAWVRRSGPPPLADAAAELAGRPREFWLPLLRQYWTSEAHLLPDASAAILLLVEAVLQPPAEALTLARGAAAPGPEVLRCPACTGLPVAGVLREEAYGARRSLVCGLCLSEWSVLRARCAACGEERFEALAVYTAEQFPHVRVEACDTCRRYVKSIDLTRDGRAEPIVDELASLPLDLWAADQGYTKVRANLLGL